MYSLALTLTLYPLSTSYSAGPLYCLICANTTGLIHIKLILISALNKALISALNKEGTCLYKAFIFVTDDVPYGLKPRWDAL